MQLRVSAIVLFLFAASAAGADWPQFRGPDGQGHAVGTGFPLRWSDAEGIVWKVPLAGRGWSSPVVCGDQIWLTAAIETAATAEQAEKLLKIKGWGVPTPRVAGHLTLKALAVDFPSGRVVRDVNLLEVDEPAVVCVPNCFATPTPVVEANRVYCEFGALDTVCLDTAADAPIWSRRLVIDHAVGAGSSAVVHGNLLILTRDGTDQQYVTGLDKATGRTVWKTNRPPLAARSVSMHKAFSTPLVFSSGGREQMVVPGAQWIVSYEPATGKELWRVDTGGTFSNIPSVVYGCGLVFVCTSYGGSLLLAIRPDGQGNVTETHVAWRETRSVPKRSSPLLEGDELYMISDSGVASCLDARSGKQHWSERLPGAYSASPVAAEGRIYFFAEDGRTTVVRAGTSFVRLAENRLAGRVLASPAFVSRSIILRTETHLYRIAGTAGP